MSKPRDVEKMLEYFHSLPDNDELSDLDSDDEISEENFNLETYIHVSPSTFLFKIKSVTQYS